MLQFEGKALIVVILLIYVILSINALDSTCQLLMCTRPDNLEAVAIITSASDVLGAQTHIAYHCPQVTNITKCDISCTGPYNSKNTTTYYLWKQCIPQSSCSGGYTSLRGGKHYTMMVNQFHKRKDNSFDVFIYKSKTNQHGLNNLGSANKILIPADNPKIIANYEKYFSKQP
ncbi:1268_t:CDS:2, partial [Racocetra persica]